jgi:uncharacterized repeat protein (TIGR03803 family)
MKNPFRSFHLPLLACAVAAWLSDGLPMGEVGAQTFTRLHSFTTVSGSPTATNDDGATPYAGLVLAGNLLYGTTFNGGSLGNGTLFRLALDGTGFTNLHTFNPGSDGGNPATELMLGGNTLFGTTTSGGAWAGGTLFAVGTNGAGFTNLHSLFASSDGSYPKAGLMSSGNVLYGTTYYNGGGYNGALFKCNTNGTGFTALRQFSGNGNPQAANSDGANPQSVLILEGGALYGTAVSGGIYGWGTIYKLDTLTPNFTTLHSFSYGSDGANPTAGMILSGNILYGTTSSGGGLGNGTIFAMNLDGTGFTNLHNFSAATDGAIPSGGLILSGNVLYGTALAGGSAGSGTVFAMNTDGTGFTTLHNFVSGSDGANPSAGLILAGNALYGTAFNGGDAGKGTVFRLSLPPPQLTIIFSGANVILTWPTNATGFTLQAATNLGSPTWGVVSPAPTVINGRNAVTNAIAGSQKFYRLGP